jgi:hypothetical protein
MCHGQNMVPGVWSFHSQRDSNGNWKINPYQILLLTGMTILFHGKINQFSSKSFIATCVLSSPVDISNLNGVTSIEQLAHLLVPPWSSHKANLDIANTILISMKIL